MDLRALEHDLISANIANTDTPGYKARHIDFHETLKEITGEKLPLTTTSPMHSPGKGMDASAPVIKKDPESGVGLDGNNVRLDKEMGDLAVNQLLYNTYAQVMARRLEWLKDAIRG